MQTILAWQKKAILIRLKTVAFLVVFYFFILFPPLPVFVRMEVLNCICFLVNTFVLLARGGGWLGLGSGPGMKRGETGKSVNISAIALPNFPSLEQALARESNFKLFWLAPQLVESKNEKYSLKRCQFFSERMKFRN